MNSVLLMIIAGLILVVAVIIIIVTIVLSKNNKPKEEVSSILDVDDIGVNNNQEFSYGYEKEETIVMDPITSDSIDNNEEKETKEENEQK